MLVIRLLSSVIPIILFIIFCKRKSSKELWVFFFYITISSIFDLFLASSLWAASHRILIWNLFGIIEMGFLSYFFYLIINHRLIRLGIILLSLFYLIFAVFHFNPKNGVYSSVTPALGTVIILLFCLCYFFNVMKPTAEHINIFTPEFILVCALLLNVSFTLFLTIISNGLTTHEMVKYWILNNYALILTNIIVSVAFLVSYNQHKPKPPESQHVDFTSSYDR